jgi:hypothetical protein
MLKPGPRFETFQYHDETWTRFPAPPADEAFICGVDLGQSQDPTALIVMRHTRMPLETWTVDQKKRTRGRTSRSISIACMPSGFR